MTLSLEAGRVLGCLVEKDLTTPQQYPLTINALSLACNQSTNREPVMSMDETDVQRALQELKDLHLVRFVLPSHGRSVTRFRHVLDEAHGLDTARVALMAVLLLRGPQTVGELRSRTERMTDFDSLSAVHGELEVLAQQPEPLVRLQRRQPGQKEDRWQQLLAAEPNGGAGPNGWGPTNLTGTSNESRRSTQPDAIDDHNSTEPTDRGDDRLELELRIEILESEVAAVREQISELGDSLNALRKNLGE